MVWFKKKKVLLPLTVTASLLLSLLLYRGFNNRNVAVGNDKSDAAIAPAKIETRAIFSKSRPSQVSGRLEDEQPVQTLGSEGKKLLELVNAGDPHATKKLFKASTACHAARQAIDLIEINIAACRKEDREFFLEQCNRENPDRIRRLADEKEKAQVCGDVSTTDLETMRYVSVSKAAELGDLDAQSCFVESDFNFGNGVPKLSDKELEEYQQREISYLKAGMERGDWRFVRLMTTSPRSLSHSHGLLGLVTTGDDMTIYRNTRLLRLGATGDYANELDKDLQRWQEASESDPASYPPQKLAEEDAWAQDQYENHFMNSPLLTRAPAICAATMGAGSASR